MILDRRPGQRDAITGVEGVGSARLGGLRVLDLLRLVEHNAAPRSLAQELDVALQQSVAGDYQGVTFGSRVEGGAARTARPVMYKHREIGGEPLGLFAPVVDHRCRTHEQRRPAVVGFPVALNQRQCLNRLAQAHVIGKAATEPPLAQEPQPCVAAHLVRAKGARERGRRVDVRERRVGAAELRQQIAKRARGLNAADFDAVAGADRPDLHLDDVSERGLMPGLRLPEPDRLL